MDLKTASKKPIVRIAFMVATSLFIVCCCMACLIASPGSNVLTTPTPTKTSIPSKTPAPSVTPLPTNTLPPIDDLENRIRDLLGDSNRDIERLTEYAWDENGQTLFVQFSINDNLFESFIITGIQSDITEILKTVSQSGLVPGLKSITISGTFSLVDNFGNTSEDIVISLTFNRATIDKINWDNFLYTKIFGIADDDYFHPALQKMILEQ